MLKTKEKLSRAFKNQISSLYLNAKSKKIPKHVHAEQNSLPKEDPRPDAKKSVACRSPLPYYTTEGSANGKQKRVHLFIKH